MLYSSSISQKKKEKMIKMVADKFQGKSEGISFDNFKTFYNVLFGGADLERAMFFLDNKNNGVKMCFFFDFEILRCGCLKGLILRWARKRVL